MANSVGVVWHNVHEFEQAIARTDERVRLAAKDAGVVAGRELAAAAGRAAPHGATGALAGSLVSRATVVSGTPVVRVGPTVVYGRRIELGFKGRKSARGVRKRRAAGIDTGRRGLQPTKGSHFLEKTLAASRDQIAATFKRAWAGALSKH